MEVGARNAAAPPWEGRLMAFGQPNASPQSQNDRIQDVLLATRPYGATPIAGMLDDAREFLWNDNSDDPLDNTKKFGPKNDPFVAGGCRGNYIILLSDGEPNMDLRPHCEPDPPGKCPYPRPEDTAYTLSNDPTNPVKTFVIGFAVSNVTLASSATVDCKSLSQFDLSNPAGLCATNPTESQLQACCVLNRVAYSGGTNRAYFANDKDELRAALSAILSSLSSKAASRTLPVFASVSGGAAGSGPAGFRVFSSFKPLQFGLWAGILERQRLECELDSLTNTVTPIARDIDQGKGDDFVWNVNSGKGPPRQFWTIKGDLDGGQIHSERSIRPNMTSNADGIGTYGGTAVWGDAETWNTNTPPEALAITGGSCPGLTATQCRDRYLRWLDGADQLSSYSRCATPGSVNCQLVGDIYHSTPRVVTKPDELLRDESYELFALQNAKRHMMLYVSTNDGFLHGFKMASGDPSGADPLKVDKDENNELWAFVPPAVLPSIKSQYPPAHQTLLDGVPVVGDVIAVEDPPNSGKYKFERSKADAQGGKGQWRTILVQSFGGNRGGYFAVDITDPVVPADPMDPQKGPKFLWQLTEADDGKPLFGRGGATPLITTLFFDDGGGAKEVAVAVLPGGEDPDPPAGGSENRKNATPADVDSRFPVRSKIPKYENDDDSHAARALTVVRLDSGEVIRTFRADKSKAGAWNSAGRALEVDIDSPITGIPVAFPAPRRGLRSHLRGRPGRDPVARRSRVHEPRQLEDEPVLRRLLRRKLGRRPPHRHAAGPLGGSQGQRDRGLLDRRARHPLAQNGVKNFAYSILEQPNAAQTSHESHANWFVLLKDGERDRPHVAVQRGAVLHELHARVGLGAGVWQRLEPSLGHGLRAAEDARKQRLGSGRRRQAATPGFGQLRPVHRQHVHHAPEGGHRQWCRDSDAVVHAGVAQHRHLLRHGHVQAHLHHQHHARKVPARDARQQGQRHDGRAEPAHRGRLAFSAFDQPD
ncbi:MAG: hypothetical protein U0263_38830 [Polyangiaceae bacterium]